MDLPWYNDRQSFIHAKRRDGSKARPALTAAKLSTAGAQLQPHRPPTPQTSIPKASSPTDLQPGSPAALMAEPSHEAGARCPPKAPAVLPQQWLHRGARVFGLLPFITAISCTARGCQKKGVTEGKINKLKSSKKKRHNEFGTAHIFRSKMPLKWQTPNP